MAPLVEEISPPPDPVRCCERLEGLPYRLFLDSAATGTRLGRYSFLAADPVTVVRSRGAVTECVDPASGAAHVTSGGPLPALRACLADYRADPVAGLPPFQGGLAGYVGYDWGLTLERLPAPRYDDLALPDLVLALYDWVLGWDHERSRAWLVSTGIPETDPSRRAARAAARGARVRAAIDGGDLLRAGGPATSRVPAAVLAAGPPSVAGSRAGAVGPQATAGPDRAPGRGAPPSHPVPPAWWPSSLELRSSFTRDGYLDAVARVREYIFAGDIFQANLSQRFETALHETPWSLYRRLRARNAAPFAAFADFPEATIVSASPERFLAVDPSGHVETRPIKGTRPRGLGPEHDAALGQALAESAKDRAENLMIVDLMRNDLSRVCQPGSVRVADLFALERYATVHHLVSTVVGRLAPGTDTFDLLAATFPGGSITGAPKLRAMEIIAELEPSRRGVYCGSLGYWSVTGALDANIAIRTAVVQDGRVYFSAGGGIVADSSPEQEYRETLDKARAMIDVLAQRV